jgi:hypothetical protein
MATRNTGTARKALPVLLLWFGVVAAAAAQDGALMSLLDSGNGQITTAQAEAAAAAQYRNMDANHDGVVTEQEFIAERMKLFQAADTNHDGAVTRAEIRALAISKLQNRTASSR